MAIKDTAERSVSVEQHNANMFRSALEGNSSGSTVFHIAGSAIRENLAAIMDSIKSTVVSKLQYTQSVCDEPASLYDTINTAIKNTTESLLLEKGLQNNCLPDVMLSMLRTQQEVDVFPNIAAEIRKTMESRLVICLEDLN